MSPSFSSTLLRVLPLPPTPGSSCGWGLGRHIHQEVSQAEFTSWAHRALSPGAIGTFWLPGLPEGWLTMGDAKSWSSSFGCQWQFKAHGAEADDASLSGWRVQSGQVVASWSSLSHFSSHSSWGPCEKENRPSFPKVLFCLWRMADLGLGKPEVYIVWGTLFRKRIQNYKWKIRFKSKHLFGMMKEITTKP